MPPDGKRSAFRVLAIIVLATSYARAQYTLLNDRVPAPADGKITYGGQSGWSAADQPTWSARCHSAWPAGSVAEGAFPSACAGCGTPLGYDSAGALCPSCCGGGVLSDALGRRTGPLRPGVARAALFGWIKPTASTHGRQGYHPWAAAYPHVYGDEPSNPWGGWPGIAPNRGYINLGGTCCGPHWYDVLVEGVGLKRKGNDELILSSLGIAGAGPPDTALSTEQIDYDWEPALRLGWRFQLDAVSNIEAVYLGVLDWNESATVTTNDNNLFSIFSDYGNNPFGGFEDVDQASRNDLLMSNELDSVEVSVRHCWTTPNYRTTGSWLIGPRYIRLEDQLDYQSIVLAHFDPINMVDVGDAFFDYDVIARNNLYGIQTGIELVHCILPGLLIGAEAKGGVYANDAKQTTTIVSTTLDPGIVETDSQTEFAYATEASAYVIWQFHPLAKLRGGYEALYLDRLATSVNNFNAQPPFMPTQRVVTLQTDAELYYYGFNAGLELGW
jgi:hypothetical protein